MVAHTINKNIDEKLPASLSNKFLQDILKKQINRHICLTVSICMGFAMSMLGFGKIMNFLGSILEWLYPLMIIYAVYKLIDKKSPEALYA
jgi:branched-subunit amino acid permease